MGKVLDRPYAMDYYTWPQAQAGALRRLAAERADLPLDLDHLAEEVEEFGKSERRAVRSQMRRLLEHLLKLQYATATESGAGWRRSIVDARIELADNLTPLHRDLEADLADLYEAAREQTAEALRDRTRRGAEAARALSVDVVGGAAGGAFRSGLDHGRATRPRSVSAMGAYRPTRSTNCVYSDRRASRVSRPGECRGSEFREGTRACVSRTTISVRPGPSAQPTYQPCRAHNRSCDPAVANKQRRSHTDPAII